MDAYRMAFLNQLHCNHQQVLGKMMRSITTIRRRVIYRVTHVIGIILPKFPFCTMQRRVFGSVPMTPTPFDWNGIISNERNRSWLLPSGSWVVIGKPTSLPFLRRPWTIMIHPPLSSELLIEFLAIRNGRDATANANLPLPNEVQSDFSTWKAFTNYHEGDLCRKFLRMHCSTSIDSNVDTCHRHFNLEKIWIIHQHWCFSQLSLNSIKIFIASYSLPLCCARLMVFPEIIAVSSSQNDVDCQRHQESLFHDWLFSRRRNDLLLY